MALYKQIDFNKGTVIDNISKVAGTITGSTFSKMTKGQALMTGANQYVTYPTQLLPDGAFSYVVWAKLKATHVIGTHGAYAVSNAVNANNGVILSYLSSPGRVFLMLNTIGQNTRSWDYVPDYNWHCYIITIPGATQTDMNNATLTVDNVSIAVASTNVTGTQLARSGFTYIGGGNSAVGGCHIAKIKVYDTVLTSAEQTKEYEEFLQASPLEKPRCCFEYPRPTDLSNEKLSYQSIQAPIVTVKGGVIRNIDQATGDIARTTTGWIEDNKYKVIFASDTSSSGNDYGVFDSANPRTGRLVVKFGNSATTGRCHIDSCAGASTTILALYSRDITKIKPSTAYKITFYSKTVNRTSGSIFQLMQYTGLSRTANTSYVTISGTTDWTKREVTFTSGATTDGLVLRFQNTTGAIEENYIDWNSISLEEVSTITNSSSSPALYYPKATAVTSNDNIDQSQVTISGDANLGAIQSGQSQTFTPTKKGFYGFTFQKNANVGSPTADVVATLKTTVAGVPDTTVATYTITAANWDLIPNATDYTVVFPCVLTVGNVYAFALETTKDASNYRRIKANGAGGYTGGAVYTKFGATWDVQTLDLYFKTLYSKNTTNFTVRTDTQEVSVTAPTVEGWANGTIIDTALLNVTPLTLAPGSNTIYYSSNGSNLADGETDESLQAIIGGTIKGVYPSLIAAYNMIPNGSTLVDISGNGKDLAVTGMLRTKEGLKSNGNGSNSGLSIATPIFNNSTIWSIACRIKNYKLGANTYDIIFGGEDRKNILLKYTNKISFRDSAGSFHTFNSTSTDIAQKDIDLVFSSNGTTISLYIDGVFDSLITPTTTQLLVNNIIDGYSSSDLYIPDVTLVDFRAYNYALTQTQAKIYHNSFVKPYIVEDLSNNAVNEVMPKGFVKGTGAFAVKEYNIASTPVRLDDFTTDTTGSYNAIGSVLSWNVSTQDMTFVSNGTSSNPGFTYSSGIVLTKMYKVKFRAKSTNITGKGFYAIGNLTAGQFITINNPNITTSYQNYEFNFISGLSGSAICRFYISQTGDGYDCTVDNIEIYEIPPLPTIKQGTKYLECTSTGTLGIQNKLAYGTFEFDYYKASDTSNSNLFLVADSLSIASVNGYSIYVPTTERLQFTSYTAGTLSNIAYTNTAYLGFNTWYRFRITRTIGGSFTALIKGGSFTPTAGYDGWTLVSMTGGSGTNPFVSTTFSSSNYMLFDLNAGDRLAGISILDGIKQ